jgi:hypothetical protein
MTSIPTKKNSKGIEISKIALQKRVPKKLESLMNNKLLENKYNYFIKKDPKSGSFVDNRHLPPELGNYNFHYTHNIP